MTDVVPFLAPAIEELYASFEDVPLPERLGGCSCCLSQDEEEAILKTDRRVVTVDQLDPFVRMAHNETGVRTGYLYYLPRIIELLIMDHGWIEPERIFDDIGTTEPSTWPEKPCTGLEVFMFKAIEGASKRSTDRSSFGGPTLVCAMTLSGLHLEPWLAALLDYPELVNEIYGVNRGPAQTGHLSCGGYISVSPTPFNKNSPFAEYYERRHARHVEAQAIVVDWIRSDAVLEIVTDPTYEAWPNPR